jgi:acyl carrier protein
MQQFAHGTLHWRDDHARLLIGYGCTEARGATSRWCMPEGDPALVDVGRPTAGMEAFVLDGKLRLTPIGVPGEVYLGGDIAAGYVSNPAATAERFIPHPLNPTPGARLFRTGDMGRWLPDGNLEILGRVDDQVKIRGFRIELGEIETALAQHPGVRQNLVVAREDRSGEKRLIGYVVPQKNRTVSPSELRRSLREKLPEYMLPSAFLILEELPLLPNGKVDRQALPVAAAERPQLGQDYVAPRDAVEEQLATIWTEVLGFGPIGVHDSFFDIGGHSLLAIQLMDRIEKNLRISLPVARLFEYPTIAELAGVLESEKTCPRSWSSLIPIRSKGSRLPFFWVHGDLSNVHLPKYLGSDQPLYALEHQAHGGRRARYTQTETIAKHYLDEVRTVLPRGPYLLGGFSFGAVTAFEMAQQLRREGEEVAFLFMLDPPWARIKENSPPHRTLREEFQRHWRVLSRLEFREKLQYLTQRVKDKLRIRTSWITKHLR